MPAIGFLSSTTISQLVFDLTESEPIESGPTYTKTYTLRVGAGILTRM